MGHLKTMWLQKWMIQRQMTEEDFIVLNVNQAEIKELALHTKANVVPFSTLKRWMVHI